MNILPIIVVNAIVATAVIGEEARQLDAHEHGIGHLNIAFEDQKIAMQLHAPGADIVGFEYKAESSKDLASIDFALKMLARPLELFVIPNAAGCDILSARAALESGENQNNGGEDHEDHEDHEDQHTEDHGQDKNDEDNSNKEGHTEFHGEYLLTCTDPSAVTEIAFDYFSVFINALKVEVQIISDSGSASFEVKRDAPTLDLGEIF